MEAAVYFTHAEVSDIPSLVSVCLFVLQTNDIFHSNQTGSYSLCLCAQFESVLPVWLSAAHPWGLMMILNGPGSGRTACLRDWTSVEKCDFIDFVRRKCDSRNYVADGVLPGTLHSVPRCRSDLDDQRWISVQIWPNSLQAKIHTTSRLWNRFRSMLKCVRSYCERFQM